jgi:hypothetical protein
MEMEILDIKNYIIKYHRCGRQDAMITKEGVHHE